MKLINAVKGIGRPPVSVTAAARDLDIRQTTARLILDTYRETGNVFETKANHLKRLAKESRRNKLKHKLAKLARKGKKSKLPDPPTQQQEINPVKTEEPAAEIQPLNQPAPLPIDSR
jgi:transposase-like protein